MQILFDILLPETGDGLNGRQESGLKIRFSDRSPGDIAVCGFSRAGYYFRQFRKYFGAAPLHFR